eukprot:TRINITY_DN26164_c0_g1_i1.p1 TRINITY_DN26164_c0_g1~~TRINITY_DN26164_c0_g1_i1.p1  ORF type:complete len:300 (+),score=43.84 TRINITY_DN26164_c0_g1_i1:83-901(+)
MKRAAPAMSYGMEPPAKQMMGAPADQGEPWQCKQCGNENWPKRTVCNKKGCGQVGPWLCHGCGNQNYQGRAVCNRKTCGRPAPVPGSKVGMMQGAPAAAAPMGNIPGIPGVNIGAAAAGNPALLGILTQLVGALTGGGAPMAAAAPSMGMHTQQLQGGEWTCIACRNRNWASRTECNKCKMPKNKADSAKQKAAPEGSWICTGCQNINWPTRSTCNNNKCGLPREQADGGAPTVAAPQADPEGSWGCPQCGNTNWPQRTVCNKKSCGAPRPM